MSISVSSSTPDSGTASSPPKTLTPLLRRLHFYAGLLIAPFLVVATITGGLYAIAPTVENVMYRNYLEANSDGPAKPVAEQVRAAQRVLPNLHPTAVQPGIDGATTRVLFDDPTLGESLRWSVFVNPATTQSQGVLEVYGSSGALPLRTWLSGLHRNLHLGEPGRIYSELAASWLWVVALGGLALWIGRFRTKRRAGAPARLLTLKRPAKSLDWHGVVGVWLVLGMLFLAATGLTWSRFAGENVADLRTELSWNSPSVDSALSPGTPAAAGNHDGHGAAPATAPVSAASLALNISRVDAVLATANSAGLSGVLETSIPADATTAFVVKESRVPWVFSRSVVAIDGATDTVTDIAPFADWPFVAKLAEWGIQLHMGILFGLVSQLALVLFCIGLLSVIIRGYLMWWRRGRGDKFGKPPASGTWRSASPLALAGVAVTALVLGWFVPLMGVSLAAFLAIDVGLRAVKRVR